MLETIEQPQPKNKKQLEFTFETATQFLQSHLEKPKGCSLISVKPLYETYSGGIRFRVNYWYEVEEEGRVLTKNEIRFSRLYEVIETTTGFEAIWQPNPDEPKEKQEFK